VERRGRVEQVKHFWRGAKLLARMEKGMKASGGVDDDQSIDGEDGDDGGSQRDERGAGGKKRKSRRRDNIEMDLKVSEVRLLGISLGVNC
jgi:hypothetical protein